MDENEMQQYTDGAKLAELLKRIEQLETRDSSLDRCKAALLKRVRVILAEREANRNASRTKRRF